MDDNVNPDSERPRDNVRGSRRDALRLLGAGAGVGVLYAAAAIPGAARQNESTPVSGAPMGTATPSPDSDSLFFQLSQVQPVVFASGARVQFARATEFPVLSGLSLAIFDVEVNTARELHWHNNAGELGWCLGGEGRMVLLDDDGAPVSFSLTPGSVFFAPKGLPHAFWPTGDEPLHILLGFDHPQPATIDFSQIMPPLPPGIIARAAAKPANDVPVFPVVPKPFAVPVAGGTANVPVGPESPDAGRFTVRISDVKEESFAGGTRHRATIVDLAALEGIKTTLLTLDPGATREPHWHPEMDEVCFVLEGTVQVGITGPNGVNQSATVTVGDLAFAPVNWLHYISNVGEAPAQLILFHDATTTRAVELSAVLSGFPPAILAASYGMDPAALAALAGGDASPIADSSA